MAIIGKYPSRPTQD